METEQGNYFLLIFVTFCFQVDVCNFIEKGLRFFVSRPPSLALPCLFLGFTISKFCLRATSFLVRLCFCALGGGILDGDGIAKKERERKGQGEWQQEREWEQE